MLIVDIYVSIVDMSTNHQTNPLKNHQTNSDFFINKQISLHKRDSKKKIRKGKRKEEGKNV